MSTNKKNKLIIGLSSTVLSAIILATAPSAYAQEFLEKKKLRLQEQSQMDKQEKKLEEKKLKQKIL